MKIPSLHLTTLGPNQTEIRYGAKYVLFSYQTPVAYSDEQGRVFVTEKKYTSTTSKHISKWVGTRAHSKVSQNVVDGIVK